MKFDNFVRIILENLRTVPIRYKIVVKEYGFPLRIDGKIKDLWSMETTAVSKKKALLNVFHNYFENSGLKEELRGIQWVKFKKAHKEKHIQIKPIISDSF
jgi:hypothetical protein